MKTILQDPRYRKFVETYAFDLDRFFVEVCGVTPSSQQLEILKGVEPPGSRTSVASGHSCFGRGTEIMLRDGSIKAVEDVAVGDRLMGWDGASHREVLSLARGVDQLYRFTYHDGTSHVFNEGHILCLIATNSKGRRVAGQKTTVTVREYLTWGADKRRCHAIYRSAVQNFDRPAAALPIPAYVMGAWLGDGMSRVAGITTADPEILAEFTAYVESWGGRVRLGENRGKASSYYAAGCDGWRSNRMQDALRALGVIRNKHIPDAYLYASMEDRLQLLAGLIDTDGCADDGKQYDIVQKNEILARQIVRLARSVGCAATIRPCRKKCVNNGKVGDYFRITICRNVRRIPVRLPRRMLAGPASGRQQLHWGIKSVEPLGEGEYFGFALNGDRMFQGGDSTVLHNTGKSVSIGGIVLWHLICFYSPRERKGSITMLTANDISQVRNIVWKEIEAMYSHMQSGPHAWICPYVRIMERRIYMIGHKSTWFVFAKTAPAGKPNGLAGQHGDWLMIIADEAASLPDANFSTMTGALSHKQNRMLLTSQPVKNTGFFYETHHKLSRASGGVWTNITLNSEESPYASDEFIAEKRVEYGGRDSEEYGIRVLGLFPSASHKYLMTRKMVEAMFERPPVVDDDEPYGWIIPVDVAAGEYRDKSVVMAAKVVGNADFGPDARRVHVVRIPVHSASIQPDQLAGNVYALSRELENASIAVDAMGMGILFVKHVEKMDGLEAPVQRVVWGRPCFMARHKERFFNRRAQAFVSLRDAMRDGRISIEDRTYKADILNQGSRLPYGYDNRGRYQIASKGSAEWEGLPSPDLLDDLAFLFLAETTYIPVMSVGMSGIAPQKSIFDMLSAALDDPPAVAASQPAGMVAII